MEEKMEEEVEEKTEEEVEEKTEEEVEEKVEEKVQEKVEEKVGLVEQGENGVDDVRDSRVESSPVQLQLR
ncbi:Protein stu1 [Dirofilaria immitis]